MLIIGEKLNSSIPSALKAFQGEECEVIDLIRKQSQAGADYLDINTAMLSDEQGEMEKTAELLIKFSDKGIMIDTVNMIVAASVLNKVSSRPVIINSISLSTDTTPLKGLDLREIGVVAMPTNDDGIPETPEKRLENIKLLVNKLLEMGFSEENIYADILIETLAVNQNSGVTALNTLKLIKENLNIKTICGASNISFGLPKRKLINCAFLPMAMLSGLDAAIIDIINPDIRAAVLSSDLLMGKDEFCMNYIENMRD